MLGELNKPNEWPAMIGHIAELLSFTKDKHMWFMLMESPTYNRGAFEIANSVLKGLRLQSYVARGILIGFLSYLLKIMLKEWGLSIKGWILVFVKVIRLDELEGCNLSFLTFQFP